MKVTPAHYCTSLSSQKPEWSSKNFHTEPAKLVLLGMLNYFWILGQEIVVASLIPSILWREKGPTWWQVSLESKLITFLFLGGGGRSLT